MTSGGYWRVRSSVRRHVANIQSGPENCEHEYDCRLNDLELYLFIPVLLMTPRVCQIETDRNSVSVSVTAPKLAIVLVSVTAVIVKHGFGMNRNCPG